MGQKNKKFWEFRASTSKNSAELLLYGPISEESWWGDEVTPKQFADELKALGDISELTVRINSGGGDVFAGQAIHSLLKSHKAKVIVYVDGLAASIASVIAMAGDTVIMPRNAMMMIHNPWTVAIGNAKELRKVADDLDRISVSAIESYLQKAGDKLDEKTLKQLLDEETWLTADEAKNYGLCDVVQEPNNMAASISDEFLQRYKNVPEQLIQRKNNILSAKEMAERKKIAEQAKANLSYYETILGGIMK